MTETVTIALDANGADRGPAEVAAGAALATAAGTGVRVLLFGPRDAIGAVPEGVEVVDAPVSIAKAPDPARAARSAPDASIVQAAAAVAEGRADALVTGGSTGTALAAALFNIRRAPGVHRPALALPLPIPGAPVLLLDVGANNEARPEHLVQYAYMGAAFAGAVLGVQSPRVALLSNGSEPERGAPEVIAAHGTLATAPGLRFVGNVEGNGLVSGAADVVVTDGFTGNVALKLLEGMAGTLVGAIREAALESTRGKLGGALLRPALGGLRDQLDPEAGGGAYLLGLRGLGVAFHGRFSAQGIARAIEVAAHGVRGDVVGRTQRALEEAGALRGSASEPAASVADRA